MHRRSHMGARKIASFPHMSRGAPKNLCAFQGYSCLDCATANINKPAHSGSLDTPAARPGKIHVDLKGPFKTSIEGYVHAAIFIDEYTRYVWVIFLKRKSDVVKACELVKANYNATIGVAADASGVTLARPEITSFHSDHEGGLESQAFVDFRAANSIHHTMSRLMTMT